jgi:hypothetical protein
MKIENLSFPVMEKSREIVIEIERTRVIACRLQSIAARCRECRADSEFVEPAEAAALVEASAQKIFALADIGTLHTEIFDDGRLLVCLGSLLNTSFL